MIALFEKGAIDDKEALREALATPGSLIKTNRGFRFELLEPDVRHLHWLIERGALDDEEAVRAECQKPIALVEYNKGFRCELLRV